MLYEIPRQSAQKTHLMFRVDLDGDLDPNAKTFTREDSLHTWASPNQVCKDITPRLMKIGDVPEADKALKKSQKFAGEHFLQELRTVADLIKSDYFKRAAALFEQHREAIVQIVGTAYDRMTQARKEHFKAKNEAVKTGAEVPLFEDYDRVAFYLEGVSLQAHKDYLAYWNRTYIQNRDKQGVVQTNSLGEKVTVMSTIPAKWEGAMLGCNIPVGDREYTRWGYTQNTGMWMSEDEYLERLAGLEALPKQRVTVGKTTVFVALVPGTQENNTLPLDILSCMNKTDDGTDWLPQHFQSAWSGVTPAQANEELRGDLRLAIFSTENTRLRMLAWEPLSESALKRGLLRYQATYGTSFYNLIGCQQAPRDKVTTTSREVSGWVQRIIRGRPATLLEATRALTRLLIEKKGKPNKFRRNCQTKIMEDYMSSAIIDAEYAALGVFMSHCVDIAFKTGMYSHQNNSNNDHAWARKTRFESKYLTLATRTPTQAVAQASQEIQKFLGAVPGKWKHKVSFLRTQFTEAVRNVPVVLGAPTAHQQVSLWKGFADHHKLLEQERVLRLQKATAAAEATTAP